MDLVDRYQCFREICCLCLLFWRWFLRNVGNYLPDCLTSSLKWINLHSTRCESLKSQTCINIKILLKEKLPSHSPHSGMLSMLYPVSYLLLNSSSCRHTRSALVLGILGWWRGMWAPSALEIQCEVPQHQEWVGPSDALDPDEGRASVGSLQPAEEADDSEIWSPSFSG